jgi:hypothetical protein
MRSVLRPSHNQGHPYRYPASPCFPPSAPSLSLPQRELRGDDDGAASFRMLASSLEFPVWFRHKCMSASLSTAHRGSPRSNTHVLSSCLQTEPPPRKVAPLAAPRTAPGIAATIGSFTVASPPAPVTPEVAPKPPERVSKISSVFLAPNNNQQARGESHQTPPPGECLASSSRATGSGKSSLQVSPDCKISTKN